MNEQKKVVEDLKALIEKGDYTIDLVSKVIGCSYRQIQRWLHDKSLPQGLYIKAIEKAVRKLSRGD